MTAFSPEFTVFIVSMLPVVELRGGIPLAYALGLPPALALPLAVAGSLIPSIPILLYLSPIASLLRQTVLRPVMEWALHRGWSRTSRVETWGWWGLLVLVAIPLPYTGVWTGSLVAALLGLGLRQALPAIAAGALVAGLVVTLLVYHLPAALWG